MKRSISVASLVTLLVAITAVLADSKADFSGKWTMDAAKSEGLPAGMDQIMTVSQKGDQITLETKVMPPDQPAFSVNASYTLDGKEAEFTQQTQNGEAKGKRIAKWTADGRGIEVNEEVNIDTPQGAVTVKIIASGRCRWTERRSQSISLNQALRAIFTANESSIKPSRPIEQIASPAERSCSLR